ncbi:MAG: hypothetical protein MJE68_17190 [Proteobacteria bacterium]|nr:hypothetical protein [Pseudomonadota bacterium]
MGDVCLLRSHVSILGDPLHLARRRIHRASKHGGGGGERDDRAPDLSSGIWIFIEFRYTVCTRGKLLMKPHKINCKKYSILNFDLAR